MSEPVIHLRGVSKSYRKGVQALHVLHELDMDVARGEFLALMGPSGSGKSTILNLIGGRDVPGWATLAVAVFFLGGVQLISIGVLGEYLARVFNEVKGRPGYLIAEEIETECED